MLAKTGRSEIEAVLFQYLETRFPALAPFRSDTPLLEDNAIDSLGVLDLMAFLGESFGVTLEDSDFDIENLGTPDRLIAFIERKRR